MKRPGLVEDAAIGARFFGRLVFELRRPVGVAEARATLRRRFERRQADFLALVAELVYGHAASPYRRLLGLVGCEYGDLERLVGREGLEGALGSLYRRGVYLSVDELKGRRPVVRGSFSMLVDPAGLCNPRATVHLLAQSSGSRGPRTPVPLDLAFARDQAVNRCLSLDARGALGWPFAYWGVPGSGDMMVAIVYALCGVRALHWFSPLDPDTPGLDPRYRRSARALRWGSLLAGVPLPGPRYVPLDEPRPILDWIAGVLRAGGTPHFKTYTSSVVRLCRAATEAGLDLTGAKFTLIGEPVTAARLAVIRRAGGEAVSEYGSTESGWIGEWCLAPAAPDDVHLFDDLHALIQPGLDEVNGPLPPRALLLSSLRRTAPLVFLNASLGDQAELVRRTCGCPMERRGWGTHLQTIRSFEKLTGEGMTFLDADVVRVLEEVLPARFGGGPGQYQLLEEEGEDGRPRLALLIDPAVGPLDPEIVAETFLRAIGGGSGAERLMGLLWQQAGLLRVERRAPRAQASGKVLHLHVGRASGGERAT